MVRLEEASAFRPSKMRMNRNVPLAVVRLRRVFPPCPRCRESFRCSPVLLRSARGEKKILTQSGAPLPGGVANPAQEASVREKAKGTFRCCSSPLSFVYLFRLPTRPSGISSPCTLDWVGWMNVTRRDQLLLKWDEQLFRAKFLPLCVRRGFLYERGLCPQLVQQVCTHSTDIGGLQWRLSAEAPLSAGSLCLDNSTRSKK